MASSAAGQAFAACTLAPVGAPTMSTGYPDGGPNPTVVVDYRQVFVIRPIVGGPDNGMIQFAVHPSPLGGLAIHTGRVASLRYVVNNAGDITGTTSTTNDFTNVNGTDKYSLLPFRQNVRGASGPIWGTVQNDSAFGAQAWRVLSNKAHVVYSGDTFNNGGSYSVARQQIKVERLTEKMASDGYPAYAGQYRQYLNSFGPDDFSTNSQIPGSLQGAVADMRSGLDLINVPYDYAWQGWQDNATPIIVKGGDAGYTAFAQYLGNSESGQPAHGPTPGVGFAPTTFFSATGMAAEQTITVSIQTCVEYTLDSDSPMQQMAKMPPSVDQSAIDFVKNAARGLPAAKPANTGNWFTNSLSWYGGAMKDIYQGITGTASEVLIGRNIWGDKSSLGIDAGTARTVLGGLGRMRGRASIR